MTARNLAHSVWAEGSWTPPLLPRPSRELPAEVSDLSRFWAYIAEEWPQEAWDWLEGLPQERAARLIRDVRASERF